MRTLPEVSLYPTLIPLRFREVIQVRIWIQDSVKGVTPGDSLMFCLIASARERNYILRLSVQFPYLKNTLGDSLQTTSRMN